MKVGIISINIGSYIYFWQEFYDSAEINFLPDTEKEYFIFTDAEDIYQGDNSRVHKYHQSDMGWPFNTMKRFHLFHQIRKDLWGLDYLFFANANSRFAFPLTEAFLLPEKNLIVVEHPGRHGDRVDTIPWERREESRAYVPYEKGRIYVQGAFYGGKTEAFLSMAEELDRLTEADLEENIIAVWHDESFLNKYIIDRLDVQILGWQYLSYEENINPYLPVIMLRDKRKYITNKNGRFKNQNYLLIRILQFMRNVKWFLLIKLGIYQWYEIKDKDGNYVDLDIS